MKKKKKIDWRRTLKNNVYMLGLIYKACPGILIMTFLSAILGAVNSFLLNTYLYKYALNALQEGKEVKQVLITVGLMFAYTVAYMIFAGLNSRYMDIHSPVVEEYIQKKLQKKAVEVELACFERPEFYDTYVKATGEASGRAFAVLGNISNVIWIVFNVTAVGALIITIAPIFMIFAFLPLACTLLVGKRQNRLKYERDMRNQEEGRKKYYVSRSFYLKDFSKEMRLTEMWKVMIRGMHETVDELREIASKYGFKLMWFAYLFDFVFDIAVYSGTIIFAAFKTLVKKNMLLGDCFVVINSITNIASSINYFGETMFKLDEHSLYIDNLRSFLEYEAQMPEDKNAPLAPSLNTLELRDVGFKYEGQSNSALKNIQLSIRAGEKIAIVGHNGAGKTTLIKLLMRLYDPDEGEILLNGKNIKKYRLSSYRGLYGTVFQDYQLFAVSVAENVLLHGHLSTEDEKLTQTALEKSGISEKIHSLPKGIHNTVTKEFDSEGAVFSGGEAQKLAIARIFAGKNEIVILDEPTSALDPIAEQEMYNNMFAACEGKTVIFISHRLSSATMADRVYLFEHGQIAEQGTHRELLELNGKYADMWHKQADTYVNGLLEEVRA